MTVKQLYDELSQLIKEGHGDTRIIANCEFNITKGNGYYNDFPLCYLKDVYYQSNDIELEFSQEEEFTEENKYKDDDNGWHDLRKDPTDLPKDNDEKLCFYGKGKVVARYNSEYSCWETYFNNLETVIPSSVIIAWKEIIPPKE